MSVVHPKDGDYEVRGMILQTIFALVMCLMLGPVVGWFAREVIGSQEVWAFSLLALGILIHIVGRNLRYEYVEWGYEVQYKKRMAKEEGVPR